MFFFFFFSSRRRHTRFDCDWSSDVCSSDLAVIPAFHHPAHLGGDLAMLDNMSRGRLDAGFGRAFLPKEFEVYGVPMSESRERFEEAIGMIRKMWTEERVSQKGRFWSLEDVRL